MQAAILAGGLGTRLRPLTEKIPKALLPVNGRPFLEYEIELLKANAVDDLVLCVGHLGEQIEEHFGDGKRFRVRIRYSYDGRELLGPVGGLKNAEPLLADQFFVTYGDAYLRMDYARMMATLNASKKLGVMAIFRNEGRFGKSDIIAKDGLVTAYDKKRTLPGMSWVNFGVTALRKAALDRVAPGRFCDEESFYGALVEQKQLMAFETFERFYEVGSPEGIQGFARYLASGR